MLGLESLRPLGTRAVTRSGGTMELLAHHGQVMTPVSRPDLAVLEPLRTDGVDVGPLRPAGDAPFLQPGQPLAWHYGRSTSMARVVSDDERGLVCWVASGAPQLVWTLAEGAVRDLPLAQRFRTPRVVRRKQWRGPGNLRVSPTGAPWSLWWFYDQTGSYTGLYVNIELPHARPVGPLGATYTRDLVLDLWIDSDGCWLKDADELAAYLDSGRLDGLAVTPQEAAAQVEQTAQAAISELFDATGWPFNQGFELFRPTRELELPVEIPVGDPLAETALAALNQ